MFALGTPDGGALYCSLYYLTGNHRRRRFGVQYRFLGLLAIIGIGVINGITYSKWMTLFGNGANFGIHRFSIQVNVRNDASGDCVLAMLTLFPLLS